MGKFWLILAASEPVAEAGTPRVLPLYRQNQPISATRVELPITDLYPMIEHFS
jgi:hypothetical protein